MTHKDFEKLYKQMVKEEMSLSLTKGKEYTQGKDRFDNFKRLGKELKCPHCSKPVGPQFILWIFLKKHMDSIISYINTSKTFSESIQGRISDARLYLALLRGLIEEEKTTDTQK